MSISGVSSVPVAYPDDAAGGGAGDGNRTRMASLEGWSSTIELHPRVCNETSSSLEHEA